MTQFFADQIDLAIDQLVVHDRNFDLLDGYIQEEIDPARGK